MGALLANLTTCHSMKSATFETTPAETGKSHSRVVRDLVELVKARLTLLVLLTTAVGFYLGAEGPINFVSLLHTVFGTAAAAAGAAALNQWWEHNLDALMQRTRSRPVPAGRMRPRDAVILGSVLSIFGVAYLAFVCNALSAVLAAITIIIYIFGYTPLKLRSTFNTALGAVPGALPPMIGWAAARGTLNAGAWMLFAILFFWQLPHFFAIAWMYRDDYARAGFQMISSVTLAGLLWLRQLEVNALRQRTVSSYGNVPEFTLINQDGKNFGSADLRGKIWIADFVYSTCPGPCPMISSRMSELQKPLEKTDVHLVSFTVDPAKDTPPVLRGYAEKLQAEPGRWDFLTGPQSTIYNLSRNGFKLVISDGSEEKGIPVHSTRMILVDRHGAIRGYYAADEVDAVTKLVADTTHLLREQPK